MSVLLVFFVCLVATTSAQSGDEECGETSFYGPSGVISSPNYPDNYDDNLYCDYNVYSSVGSSFSFIFNAFRTETSTDFVTISCATNSSFPPQVLSGKVLPDPVSVPWCSEGRFNFRSDYSINDIGFNLDYFVSLGGCGNTLYSGLHGFVTSPNYPGAYGLNQNCTNIIWAPQKSRFELRFLGISMPQCGVCTCDWVEISCLDNNPSYKHRFCGSTEYSVDIDQCTRVLVWFYSDSSTTYQGFNLEYNVIADASTAATTTLTPSQTSAATTTLTPSQTSAATTTLTPSQTTTRTTTKTTTGTTTRTTTKTTTAFVQPNCGNTDYYGPSGVISSPDYPDNYSNDLSCNYYVNASSSTSSIAVVFQAFDTEQCCDYVTISCPTNSAYPSVRYSGSSLPQPLSITSCDGAAVNFTSDGSTVSTGFSLDYYVSLGGCGDTVYTGSHGIVSSPNYPNSYENDQNCSNIVWASLRGSFSIIFLYMNVEECCDFVELSCLDNAEYGSHRFTGTSIPDKLDIPGCTQVLVWFYADDSVAQTGFNLEYFFTPDSDDSSQRKMPSNGTPNAKEKRQ